MRLITPDDLVQILGKHRITVYRMRKDTSLTKVAGVLIPIGPKKKVPLYNYDKFLTWCKKHGVKTPGLKKWKTTHKAFELRD